MKDNKKGDRTQILPLHSPSILILETLEVTHINITYEYNNELIIYNQLVQGQINLEFLFDSEIKFDFLNSNHIHASLNGISLDSYFTKNNVSIRGSYIVSSGQLYVGYFSGPEKE